MTHGSTSHAPRRFMSPSPDKFDPVIDAKKVSKMIRAARKRMKSADEKERYALTVLIEKQRNIQSSNQTSKK